MANIIAKKNGVTRAFTEFQWKALNSDKLGWKRTAEVPAEVKELEEKKVNQDNTQNSREEELKSLTFKQLKEIAKNLGVEKLGTSSNTLIKKILKAEA